MPPSARLLGGAIGAAAAVVAAFLLLAPATADEDFGGLPAGEGQELVFYACTGCHSLMIIQQQDFSRRVWSEVLDWMVEQQGMAELPPEDEAIILDYLVEHYGYES
jgi:cytochrome c